MKLLQKLKKAQRIQNELSDILDEIKNEIQDNSDFKFRADYGVEWLTSDGICLTHEHGVLDIKTINELLKWNDVLTKDLFHTNAY